MPSKTTTWPTGWPIFTPADNDPSDTYQINLKHQIIAQYGAASIKKSWVKTCNSLKPVTERLSALGNTSVPFFHFDDLLSNPSKLETVREAGCCIVRGVIPKLEADRHFKQLTEFVQENKDVVTGWPKKSVAIYHLYSTPTQLKIKTHPRHLRIQQLLNSLWTAAPSLSSLEEREKLSEPVLYPDALRIRQPGQEFLGLGPHIDGGSLCRWADASYLQTYHSIFSGTPELYDPYDMTDRKEANMSMFEGGAQCSVFRAFQGWTALTSCKPGEGGLMVVPDVKVVTAYMVLRPFMVMPNEGWEDGQNWSVCGEGEEAEVNAWFPGTYRWDSQLLSRESHPHLRLEESLMSIPNMEPGDTVWWHADMCHAVETTHNGLSPASVVYIPACPSTEKNLAYIRQHWKDLVAGVPPDDYKYLDGTGSELVLSQQNERLMKDALDLGEISTEGRRGLGEGR